MKYYVHKSPFIRTRVGSPTDHSNYVRPSRRLGVWHTARGATLRSEWQQLPWQIPIAMQAVQGS